MILERIYHDGLAQAAYLVGCPGSGEAIIVDPNRDLARYEAAAAKHGLKIAHVTETHIHADYLSGARELATKTGATLWLSDEGPEDWKYAFLNEATPLKHGDTITVGGVTLEALHTPGHTPEHLSFLITDSGASDKPQGLLSGDFIFVGDVGRPDLLETAAGEVGSREPAARSLFASVQKFKQRPGHLVIWPGHGSGSACGKAPGGVPVSSLGYELAANWALKHTEEQPFVDEVLDGQPDPPRYFAQMKRMNKQGPPARPPQTPAREDEISPDRLLIDIRPSSAYRKEHHRGSLHLPLGGLFLKWAGWLVPYDQPLALLADDEGMVRQALNELALIGLDDVQAWHPASAISDPAATPTATSDVIGERLPEHFVVDIRTQGEFDDGHYIEAHHIPLGHLGEREMPAGLPVAVHCQSGGRSPIGASVLERMGVEEYVEIRDGWKGLSKLEG